MSRLPLVSPLERALYFKAQPFFEGVDSNVLAVLASYTEEQFYPAGSVMRDFDEPIDRVFFLATGTVELLRPVEGEMSVKRIEAPGGIGISHYFAGETNLPLARAAEDTICLELATVDLAQILEDHFPLLLRMSRTSCEQAIAALTDLGKDRPAEEGFAESDQSETPIHLDLVQRLGRAKRTPLLRGTNLTVLGELIRFDDPRIVSPGEVLWREGGPIDHMVLVLDGAFRSQGNYGSCLAPSGATLGAWEILAEGARFEGWVAEERSRVLSIDRNLFIDVLEDHFEFAQTYLRRLSCKLSETWDAVARRDGTPV